MKILFFISLSSAQIIQAQTGALVAGFGYRNPANSIRAAPGQIMMLSVNGLTARVPVPVIALVNPNGTGYPTEINGISADFVQGPVTIPLQIQAVQQTVCPPAGACSPATTLTIQIPYELIPNSSVLAQLKIKEKGATAAEVLLNGVTDSVHVIDTCDQTGISLSLGAGVPAGTCAPMIMHPRAPIVSNAAPASADETLVLWAYGLGAIEHPIPVGCCSTPDQLPLAVQPFYMSFFYTSSNSGQIKRLGQAIPSYAGMVGGGRYQVHFTVPPVPADIAPCSGASGNITVVVNGPNSSDSAQICAQP